MGAENVIHFTVHMDETTPHAHWGAVPIKDGRLSWKAFFDGRGGLSAFQDRCFEKVGSLGVWIAGRSTAVGGTKRPPR